MLSKSDTALKLPKVSSGQLYKLPPATWLQLQDGADGFQTAGLTAKVSNPARERYLKQCHGRTMTPLPIPFMLLGPSLDVKG